MNWHKLRSNLKKYGISTLLIVLVIFSVIRVVSAQPPTEESVNIPTVSLLDVDSLESVEHIVATGKIESENQVTIMSEVNAPVDTVFARVGESVAPGTPSLQFESADHNAQVAQASAGVQAIQAQIALQTAPPRAEDLRRAELAVEQATANLQTALANQEKTIVANKNLIEDAQDTADQLYRAAYLSAIASASTLMDVLVTISDYQQTYFSCTNESVCFDIAQNKEDAIYVAYDIRYAGRWSSSAVQAITTGIVSDIRAIDERNIDGAIVKSILQREQVALLSARQSLVAVRQGFDAYPPAGNATATDRAIVDAQRATVDASLATIDAKLNSYTSVTGGERGNNASSVEEARTTADQNARIAQAGVDTAKASLESAQLTLKILVDGPRTLDLGPLYAQLAQANATFDLASASQRRYFISAPFAGEIIALDARPGELFSPGRAIVTIANPNALEISVFISAEDRRAISRHATVKVNDGAIGVITSIGSGVDPQTGKVEVHVAVVDNTDQLLVGESVTVTFEKEASGEEGTQVPLAAVKTTPEGSYVFSIGEGDVLIPHKITTGSIEADRIWVVFDGAKPETIIANARGLRAGDQVKFAQ